MSDLNDLTLNVNIASDNNAKQVTVITDGTTERLAVDANISTSVPSISNAAALTAAGYMYTVALSVNMAAAGVDNPLLLIKNPSGSGERLYLYKVNLGVDVNNQLANFSIYANPTITLNGTSQTPVNLFVGGGFGAATMTAFSLPTLSLLGTLLQTYEIGQNNNSYDGVQDFSIQVAANNNILITGDPGSNNRVAVITVVWAEF